MKIYFDENISPFLAKGLELLEKPNNQGFEIYSIKEEFGQGIPDEEWIPKVGAENGIVITQDIHIQRTRVQRELYQKHGLGIFFIHSPGKNQYKYWEMVKYIIAKWEDIKNNAKSTKTPFAYRCTSKKIEKI